MRRIIVALVWVSAMAVVIGFFMPWAYFEVRQPKLVKEVMKTEADDKATQKLFDTLHRVTVEVRRGAEWVTGKLPLPSDVPKEISGFEIPRLANQEKSQVMIAIAELLTKERALGTKSYAVYLLPGIALLSAILVTVIKRPVIASRLLAVACLAIAGIGFWKLLSLQTETAMIAVTIGNGLWVSLWGYVALGLSACASTL